MWTKFRFYTEVLSLDICAGVLGSAALAQTMLASTMKPCWWLLLPASVWVIYTADHLFDARKTGSAAVNRRHKFHSDNSRLLTLCAIATGTACVAAAFWCLREIVLLAGAFMGTLALAHLALAYWGKIRIGKEFSVAIVYACGVWFAPYLNRTVEVSAAIAVAFGLFLVAALLNLFMNSLIELSIDRSEQQVFALRTLAPSLVRRAVIGVAVVSFIMLLVLASGLTGFAYRWEFTYLTFLCTVPGGILFFEDYFRVNARYRLPAELAFLAGIGLLLPH